MPSNPVDPEKLIRQILKLVDLSRDLERNLDDSLFAKEVGEIIYVVDENIFEMFLRPHRHTEAVETFYADVWSSSDKTDATWRPFEIQAAIIASEFLLSGELPGTLNDAIYVTEPHRWELASRTEQLTRNLRNLVEADGGKVNEELARKVTVSKSIGQASSPAWTFHDGTISSDLRKLAEAGTTQAMIDRMRIAREVAATLARSEITEPLEQLRRVVSQPLRRQIRPLQTVFRPSEKELSAIETDAENWFKLLAKELKQPGHRRRDRAKREDTGRALLNDARSIAYLRWVANKKLNPRQRLVFVTGDPVLFDTYRRWHSEQKKAGRSQSEPFFMRRAVQFNPIFNPTDLRGDLSRGDPTGPQRAILFSLIQQAVEVVLLPLTLFEARSDAEPEITDGVFSHRRERLALKLVEVERLLDDPELERFVSLISPDWLANQKASLEEIRDLWQEVQRHSIGSSYDLLMRRMDPEEVEALEPAIAASAHDNGAALKAYVAALFDRIVEESLHLWLPFAESILAGDLPEGQARRWPKRLSLAMDFEGVDGARFTRGEARSNMPPEIVFAMAAKQTLEWQDVNNADRFASLAVRAEESARVRDGEASDLELDLKYLNANTQRYLITTVRSHLRRGKLAGDDYLAAVRSIDVVKTIYGRASSLIHACLGGHSILNEDGAPERTPWHEVRYYRALSERAALNLFMATSFGLANESLGMREDALRFLSVAKGDLKRCIQGFLPRSWDDVIVPAIRGQVLPNVAAAEVLAHLLTPSLDTVDESAKSQIRAIETHAATLEAPHPLLTAELEAFFLLVHGSNQHKAPKRPKQLWRNILDMRLPLDRVLLKAIDDTFL